MQWAAPGAPPCGRKSTDCVLMKRPQLNRWCIDEAILRKTQMIVHHRYARVAAAGQKSLHVFPGSLWPRNPTSLGWGSSAKTTRYSTGYVRVKSEVDIPEFKVALEGHRFPGRRGGEPAVAVEYAPFQRVHTSKVKRDPKEGTIEQGMLSAPIYIIAYIRVCTLWAVDMKKSQRRRHPADCASRPNIYTCRSINRYLRTLGSVDIHGFMLSTSLFNNA